METLDVVISILEPLNKAVYITNTEREILFFNKAAEQLTGFNRNELLGKRCNANILNHVNKKGERMCLGPCPLLHAMNDNEVKTTTAFLQHKEGHRIPVSIKTIPYVEKNEVIGAVEIFENTSQRIPIIDNKIKSENILLLDPLTNLLNRNFLTHKLENKLKENKLHNYAFLFIDIDDFKTINDTYGHLIGDRVLKVVSNTILANTTSDDYAIRFGGEEFLVVIEADNINVAKKRAEMLRVILNSSYVSDINYHPKVSIGVSMHNKKDTIEDAIRKSDRAMYIAKNSGKNQIFISN